MPTLKDYLARKALEASQAKPPRPRCYTCRKPQLSCFCKLVRPYESTPRLLILMHPLEARHPIGTGRLAHHCLANSRLIVGEDFAGNRLVSELIGDPATEPLLLFPGRESQNLSAMSVEERQSVLSPKSLLIVLDGTWNTARKMLYRSPNLQALPRVCFTPDRLSRFRVRKQPDPRFFSTIEAIHESLSLFGKDPQCDRLLVAFDAMIEHHLSLRKPDGSRHGPAKLARRRLENQSIGI